MSSPVLQDQIDAPDVRSRPRRFSARAAVGFGYAALLALVFGRGLYALSAHAAAHELHSHIILVPFISAYLLHLQWVNLPRAYTTSWVLGALAGLAGGGAAVIARVWRTQGAINANDYLSLAALSVILLMAAGAFLFFGRRWVKAAAFPLGFLIFAIPLPDGLVHALETASKLGSAEAANMFFVLSGTTYVRDGLLFQLPGIALEVAQECSGIRSSYVLLITSVLASYLFLKSPWRRIVLVLCVIPLGLLRNGLRILVIALLCVHISPDMINGIIHRRGGPIFFVLSLIPLFAILWFLRRAEQTPKRAGEPSEG